MDSIKAPSCPFESSPKQNHTQYKPGKLGRRGRFFYWHFLSAWPFYNLSTQTSPSCLIWPHWPEQWCLENYCCVFNSQATGVNFEGTIHSLIWGLNKDFLGCFFWWFLSNISTSLLHSCCRAIKWPSLTAGFNLFFPLDCCLGLTILKWFTHVITVNVVLNCNTVC